MEAGSHTAIVGSGAVVAAVLVVIAVAVMLWLVGTVLYWFGSTFGGSHSPKSGFLPSVRWSTSRAGRVLGSMVLLIGLLLAVLFVMTILASTIPVLGAVLMVLVLGMIVPAFMGIYAIQLYLTGDS